MNRRGFISLLAGAAGAPLVPWRALVEPVIFLPARPARFFIKRDGLDPAGWNCAQGHPWCNLHPAALTQESLEEMLQRLRTYKPRVSIVPTQLIVSPQVAHLIETDPVVREAARRVGVRGL